MYKTINEIIQKYDIILDLEPIKIINDKKYNYNKQILDIFNGKKIKHYMKPYILYIYGLYYYYEKHNYNLMKINIKKAIKFNHYLAIYFYGRYHQFITFDYILMKKYYKKLINNKNIKNKLIMSYSAFLMAYHYQYTNINKKLIEKYYNIGLTQQIINDNNLCKNFLKYAHYFKKPEIEYLLKYLEIDYENINQNVNTKINVDEYIERNNYINAKNSNIIYDVIQYYNNNNNNNIFKILLLTLVKNKDNKYRSYCLFELGKYFQNIEKNYEMMKKYYEMAITEYNDIYASYNLATYYRITEFNEKKMIEYYVLTYNNDKNKNILI